MNFIVFADNVYNPNNICCVRRYLTQVMNFDNYTLENKHAIRIYTANNESFESVYNSEKERDNAYNDLMKMLGINLPE